MSACIQYSKIIFFLPAPDALPESYSAASTPRFLPSPGRNELILSGSCWTEKGFLRTFSKYWIFCLALRCPVNCIQKRYSVQSQQCTRKRRRLLVHLSLLIRRFELVLQRYPLSFEAVHHVGTLRHLQESYSFHWALPQALQIWGKAHSFRLIRNKNLTH